MQSVGVGLRAIAGLIDLVVLVVITSCVLVVFGYGTDEDATDFSSALESTPQWLNLLGIVVGIIYFTIMEAASGTTPGKRLLKLRVVRFDGSPLRARDAIARNLFRILDGLFLYAVGAIAIWTSSTNQRLGDRIAGTIVVRSQPRVAPPDEAARF